MKKCFLVLFGFLPFMAMAQTSPFTVVQMNAHARQSKAPADEGVQEVPYAEHFDTEDALNALTIIDANNDGLTWGFDKYRNCAVYAYSWEAPGDDWLVTRGIHLKANTKYKLTFRASCKQSWSEIIEVAYGSQPTVAGLTTKVVEPTTISNPDPDMRTIEATVTPASEGTYYIGFHVISTTDGASLYLDDINLEAATLQSAPEAVTNLSVVAADKGVLQSTIRFTAPVKDLNGNDLTKIDSIVVNSGNRALGTERYVGSVKNAQPGGEYSIVDSHPSNGINSYTVQAYNESGYGSTATAEAYVGIGLPESPKNVVVSEPQKGTIAMTWDEVSTKGSDGGYVDPATVETSAAYGKPTEHGYSVGDPYATVKGERSLSFSYNTSDTNRGAHTLANFAIWNETVAGRSDFDFLYWPIGDCYSLPFRESFAASQASTDWWVGNYAGSNPWHLAPAPAADGDYGSAVWQPAAGAEAALNTYKIAVKGTTNPVLVFSDYATPGDDIDLQVDALTPEGAYIPVFHENYLDVKGDEPSFRMHKVHLADFSEDDWITLRFHYTAKNASKVALDRVIVADAAEHNLAAKISTPASVFRGQNVPVKVTVSNIGDNDASNFKVELYSNNTLVAYTVIGRTLASFDDMVIPMNVPTSTVADVADAVNISAVVSYDADNIDADNTAKATVTVEDDEVNTVSGLQADGGTNGPVTLTWTPAETTSKTLNDGFETYYPFREPFGRWSLIDGNPDAFGAPLTDIVRYPEQALPVSFIIFNADALLQGWSVQYPFFKGHANSSQMAVAPYEVDADGNRVNGDNYLVSPHLSGEAQTIRFFARNLYATISDNGQMQSLPETFEVLASNGGKSKEDFTSVVYDRRTVSSGDWQEIDINLPEGTRYFAIHQVSSPRDGLGNFMFCVDDASFSQGSGAPVGYKV